MTSKVLSNLNARLEPADYRSADGRTTVPLNGKASGTLWKPPYAVDIGEALKPGTNQLVIKVTNEWTNRLIGDRLAPADKKILSASPPPPEHRACLRRWPRPDCWARSRSFR